MKRHPSALVFECHRGPWPFNRPAAQRREQALDSSPLKIPIDRIGPNRCECAAVLAVHRDYDSTSGYSCKQRSDGKCTLSLLFAHEDGTALRIS